MTEQEKKQIEDEFGTVEEYERFQRFVIRDSQMRRKYPRLLTRRKKS